MNALGIALVWCMVQVTVVALLSGGLYFVLRKLWPAAGAAVVLTSLVVVLGLSVLALSPGPQWHLPSATPAVSSAAHEAATPPASAEPADATTKPDATTEATPAEPSVWGLLWRTTLAELSAPPAATADTAWHWPAILVCLVGLGIAAQLVWLVAGVLAVRAYRSKSRPVSDAELRELLDVLRAELGCVRPIELREADGLATAATLGWRRPLLLVPAAWRTWSPAQRRAVLAHEVAHVRGGDFLAVLLGQLSVAVHFYHPLVHWLLQRLRLEQELAADALAASVSGGQRSYLAAIAELALEQQDRPLRGPARSFLPTRNTLLRRIAMLRDSKLRFARLSPGVRGFAVGMVLLCGLVAVGLRGPAGSSPALAQAPASPPATAPASSEAADEEIDISYVPEDARGFIVVRPTALLRNPRLAAALRPVLAFDNAIKCEQLAIVIPSARGEQSVPAATSQMLVIFYGKEVVRNLDPQILRSTPERPVRTERWQGKQYFVAQEGKVSSAFCLPDDNTVLQGDEDAIRQAIAAPGAKLPKLVPQKALWHDFLKDDLVVAGPPALIPSLLGLVLSRQPNWAAEFGAVMRLESVPTMLLGMRADQELTFHGLVLAADEPASQRAEAVLQGLRTAVVHTLGQDRMRAAPQAKDFPMVLHAVDVFEKGCQQAKIERQGTVVHLAMQLDLASLNVETLLRQVRAMSQPPQSVSTKQPFNRLTSIKEPMNTLKLIGLAMHSYHDAYGHFPPAILYGPDGKTPYSWRVALLPFLDQEDLYKQYHQDEPWDSPSNRKVLEKMPEVYRMPSEPADSTRSCFFVLTGPETIFDGGKGTRLQEICDGTSATILTVEAKRDIPWTKPEDIPYDAAQPLPELGGYRENGFLVVLADGRVRLLPRSTPEATLRALITKAGGEQVETPK